MEKHGLFLIKMTHANRFGNNQVDNFSITQMKDDFENSFHTLVQHDRHKAGRSINMQEINTLPYCVYFLRDNWLQAMQQAEYDKEEEAEKEKEKDEEDSATQLMMDIETQENEEIKQKKRKHCK